MNGCNIENPSPLACVHARQNSLREQKGSREHDFDDLSPFRLWKFSDWRDILNACVVYQDVYLTLDGNGLSHESLHILAFGHICCLETCAWQCCSSRFPSFDIDVRYRYTYTMLRKIA